MQLHEERIAILSNELIYFIIYIYKKYQFINSKYKKTRENLRTYSHSLSITFPTDENAFFRLEEKFLREYAIRISNCHLILIDKY